MEEEAIAEVDIAVVDFEQHELDHDVAFALQKRVSCFAHTLQLVVHKFDTLRKPKRVLAPAHRLVSKVRKSTKATERLISLSGRKLIADCPTRWNSTYLMISRMVDVRNELSQVLEELNWDNLPNRDWKVLESMMCLLEPFAQYTSLTSGDEYTTFSTVVPVLMELDYHLEAMKEKPGLREIASLLQKELSDRFQKVLVPTDFNFDPIFVAATALDPRYRVLLNEEQLRHAKVYIMRELSGSEECKNVPGTCNILPGTSDVEEGEEENPESEPPTSFNFDPIFVAATALDPRYRVLLNKEQLRHAKVYIMRELSGIEEGENVPGTCNILPGTTDVEEGEEENPESEPPFKRFRYLPSILSEKQKVQAHSCASSPLMTLQQELDKYLSTTVEVNERLDPIQFWISNEQTYPHIAPLACDLLTIPACIAGVLLAYFLLPYKHSTHVLLVCYVNFLLTTTVAHFLSKLQM